MLDFLICYNKKTKKLIKEYTDLIWKGLLKREKKFSPDVLKNFVFNYPNTLLLHIQEGLHKAIEEKKDLKMMPVIDDYIQETDYLLKRLLKNEDIRVVFEEISEGKRIYISFVEGIFFKNNLNIKRPQRRGRRYFLEENKKGEKNFVFEIRRQTINNINNPPTDFLEVMSFLSFYELTRYLVKKLIQNFDKEVFFKKKRYLLKFFNLIFSNQKSLNFKKIESWAFSPGGFFLKSYEKKESILPLSSLKRNQKLDKTIIFYDTKRIKNKIEESRLLIPNSIVLGNDFVFPLIIGIPLIDDDFLFTLRKNSEANKNGRPFDLLPKSIKKEKLTKEHKNMIERFMYLQFLSRYQGNDYSLKSIRDLIFKKIEKTKIIKRLFNAEETSLGDPVDYYDFSELTKNDFYIYQLKKFPSQLLKNIIFKLTENQIRFINFSYPIGDNTYGLIESFKTLIPEISKIAFFGKVGATLSWDGKSHIGEKIGRVVIPEYVSSINNFNPEKFKNFLKEKDISFPIINVDSVEAIFQSEGVLLQTLWDIKKAEEAIKKKHNLNERKKIKLLIDMESWYLNLICKKFKINPIVIYYTSDNTKLPPIRENNNIEETIITSLGPRGSFALMVTGLSILNAL